MWDKQKRELQDPKFILQSAIEELETFTQSEASRLEVGENGRLVAAKENHLKKVMGLARSYIAPLFSDQAKQEQAQRLGKLKQLILRARDTIQSHSALIEKFQEGDDAQRKLAEYALLAIQRYNAVIAPNPSEGVKDIYNYERAQLLLDQEIKGQPIELPHAVSIKYDSHPDHHPARKMLKELSQTLLMGAARKKETMTSGPTHKKNIQFMMDTFHMKAIRMIQMYVSQPAVADILKLVKQATLEIDEESDPDVIAMRQLLEVGPGFYILVTGCFKRHLTDSKFMTMPILDSFRLSVQLTHGGFPYPSQHTGWALADKWVEANPLRTDQVRLFQQVDQRKKKLAQQLLSDQLFMQKVRQYAKCKREIFDQHRHLFVPLHRQLQQVIKENLLVEKENNDSVFDAFYAEVMQAPSAFEILTQTQQQHMEIFIRQPLKVLEEEWLNGSPRLRTGSPQEKFQAACQILEEQRQRGKEHLDPHNPQHAYLIQQGPLVGQAFQAIGLQYQSEKMGFAPPLLNDFERKLQACAFQQLLTFLGECEQQLDNLDPDQMQQRLLMAWSKDLQLLQTVNLEESEPSLAALIKELAHYFHSRSIINGLQKAPSE